MNIQNDYLIIWVIVMMHSIIVTPLQADPAERETAPSIFNSIIENISANEQIVPEYEGHQSGRHSGIKVPDNDNSSEMLISSAWNEDKKYMQSYDGGVDFCVTLPLSPRLKNLCKWITSFLSGRDQFEKECVRVHLYVRNAGNEALSIPLLEGQKMLSAETRPFFLCWQGGKPPYRVRLYQQFERRAFIDRELNEDNLMLDNLTLSPGNYILKIDDQESRKLRTEFLVVMPNQLPHMPDKESLGKSELSEEAKITFYATWLAAQNDGKWVFESYQRVAKIADDFYPASLLRNALADGQRPIIY